MVSLIINETGDTYVAQDDLIKRASGVLNANSTTDLNKKLLSGLKKLVNDGVLAVEDGHVYEKNLSDSEWSIAQSLKMITDTFKGVEWTKREFKKELKHVEKTF
jgi:hypothetical protein